MRKLPPKVLEAQQWVATLTDPVNSREGSASSGPGLISAWDPQVQVHGEAGLPMFDQIDKISESRCGST